MPKDHPTHDWIPSTLGHGNTMCRRCKVTDLEAEAIKLAECPTMFDYFWCPECQFDCIHRSDWQSVDCGNGICPICAGDNGRDVSMRRKTLPSDFSGSVEGVDARGDDL